jgi:hypothetical protein
MPQEIGEYDGFELCEEREDGTLGLTDRGSEEAVV